eukprot:TRINITY_DN6397_c0_g1_i4.p1 TRINITY_DN6397_c0_g1~~TRINITY_DN6397_c0_g1_i4.p1  ORF type:complete len:176 (-),score=18.76 TRINITY_DN6397_c0_g1_i4:144-650(-)
MESDEDAFFDASSDLAPADLAPAEPEAEPLAPSAEILAECERLKEAGNAAFAAQQFDAALAHYQDALALLPERHELSSVLFCNCAAVFLKQDDWKAAADQATKALAQNPSYARRCTGGASRTSTWASGARHTQTTPQRRQQTPRLFGRQPRRRRRLSWQQRSTKKRRG